MSAEPAAGSSWAVRRLLVLGANGPTGREVVAQALERGLEVVAVTRHPDAFPISDDRVHLVGGDATDPATIDEALPGCDAAISVIGTPYTWGPVEVYSASARALIAAMERNGLRRLVVVTSMGVPRAVHEHGLLRILLLKAWRMTFTRTLYDDMLRMERLVSRSGLDWTIVRPPGLSNDPARGYAVEDTRIEQPAMTRADLGAALLDQLTDTRWIHRIAAVATPGLRLELVRTIRQEVLKR